MKKGILAVMLITMILLMTACMEESGSFKQQKNLEQEANAAFLENIVDMRGSIEITSELRKSFNEFAKEYCWVYLPDMDGYESFFDTNHYAGSYGYPNFSDAVFYVLQYLNVQNKISQEDMQNAVSALFATKTQYEPMMHQNYPKFAKYENGYYSPWPEGKIDQNREFYLLTGLDICQDGKNGKLLYITVNLQNYYFNDTTVYEAGEHEKWLTKKANEMGIDALTAAHELIANGQINELEPLTEWETTMVLDTTKNDSLGYFPKFLFSRSN